MTPRTPTKYPRARRSRNNTPVFNVGEYVGTAGQNAIILEILHSTQSVRIKLPTGTEAIVPICNIFSQAIPTRGRTMTCPRCQSFARFSINCRIYKCAVCKSNHACANLKPIAGLLSCCGSQSYISYKLKCGHCKHLTQPMATKRHLINYAQRLRETRCAETLLELSTGIRIVDHPKEITRRYLSDQERRIKRIITSN